MEAFIKRSRRQGSGSSEPIKLVRTRGIPISTSLKDAWRESVPEYALYYPARHEIIVPQITFTVKNGEVRLHAFGVTSYSVRDDQVEVIYDLGTTCCDPAYLLDLSLKIWDAYGSLLSCYQNYMLITLRICLNNINAIQYVESMETYKFFGFLRHDNIKRAASVDTSIDSFTHECITSRIPREMLTDLHQRN